MTRWVERGIFLLLAAAMLIAAAALPSRQAALPEVYVYNGSAAATDAPWDEKSLDRAVYRFSHLLETYFPGDDCRRYLSVIPDKAQFTAAPAGYAPADASDTLDYLAARLPVTAIDIAGLLSLEDYYRTDPHWRQECLEPVAQTLLDAMAAPLPDSAEQGSIAALPQPFRGSYWDKSPEPLTEDTLHYLTSPTLEGCTVYDYETDTTSTLYDFAAAENAPYDLFLSGAKSLLRLKNPAAASGTLVVFRDSFGSSLVPLLVPGYATIYVVDIRYLATDALARVVDFPAGSDVLLLYSTTVLHNSITLK